MIGRILNIHYITKTYTAGETLAYGQAVYYDNGQVKKITNATKPVLGFVARTEHDRTDNIASGDTVHVLIEGEITLKAKSALALTGVTKYHAANGEISDTAGSLTLYGVQAVSKLADTEAQVRVSKAITVTA